MARKENANSTLDASQAVSAPGTEKHDVTSLSCNADATSINPEKIANARLLVARTRQWIKDNPDTARYMSNILDTDVKNGRRASMQRAIEQARARDFTDVEGRPTHISHNMRSVLARIYWQNHPGSARCFAKRAALVDCLEEFGGEY